MKLRRILVGAVVLVVTGGVAAWFSLRPVAVDLVAPRRGDVAEIVYATGTVEPRRWAKVTPLLRERIVALCSCEGEEVAAGTELARLDDREAQAALAELEARLRLAVEERDRLEVLAQRNAATQQALDRARSEVVQLEALISGQAARLESYVLRAPADGVVLRQDGEVGEIAEPGSVLAWVGQPTPLIVTADVNEEDIPRIVPGQRALGRSDAFPGRALEATVDHVTPMGDPVGRTYRVRFALPADTPLMIGMSVELNVVVDVSEGALLLPGLAVERDAVFVVEAGVARRRAVSVGIRGVQEVEILDGLDEGDRVVMPFPAELVDGARVAPRMAE